MSGIFKPNLAGKADDASIRFPVLASPKIDGVRAMRFDDLRSRSMKAIPNRHVQKALAGIEMYGFDGELVVGDPTHPNCMQNTTSGVMATDKVPEFQYHVFDLVDQPAHVGYHERLLTLSTRVAHVQTHWAQIAVANRLDGAGALLTLCPVIFVPQVEITDLEMLLAYEAERLAEGWEGVMIRDPAGKYKQGRSTPKEGGLLKVKRFTDDEATIIGFVEEMKNNNAKTVNELGRSKRSSHKDGKSGKDTLGAFILRNKAGVEFQCGSGIDDALAAKVWANRDKYLGKLVTYKSFLIGVKDAPRHPVFKSFRDPMDT